MIFTSNTPVTDKEKVYNKLTVSLLASSELDGDDVKTAISLNFTPCLINKSGKLEICDGQRNIINFDEISLEVKDKLREWFKKWGILFIGPVGFIIKYWTQIKAFFVALW